MKVSLTISGGGVRSSAGLGVIKYLEENGHEVVSLSGTSGGAILSVLYAHGLTIEEIHSVLKGFKARELFRPTRQSLFSLDGIRKDVENAIKGRKQLIDVEVCTTNYEKGEAAYHLNGDLINNMIASSSLNVFFKPAYINGELHFDGGYIDNMPNKNLVNRDIPNISVNVSNPHTTFSRKKYAKRLFRILRKSAISLQAKETDYFIDVKSIADVNLFDLKKFDFCIEEGYKEAEKILNLL